MNALTKNIVFDWNGTLLDDFHAVHAGINHLLKSEGHAPVDMDRLRTHYENRPFELYQSLGFKSPHIEKLVDLESNVFHDHYEPMADIASLRDGTNEILSYANENAIHSVILSNHIIDPIRTQLRRLKIEHFFTDILAYASRATQFKDLTKGERLQRFIKQHDVAPTNTMIIGDSLEEIDIAREQDLISVAITGGCVSEQRLRAANPNYVIHSLHELKPIMQEQGFVS